MKTLSPLFGLALVLGIGADQSPAATWAVETVSDTVDVAPGDGVCADASGLCSLRAAVMEANATPTVPDTIVLGVPLAALNIPWQPFSIDDDSSGDLDMVALNAPWDCTTASSITGGFNLDGDSTCNLTGPGDISGVDPLLGALQLNPPGLTHTHALLLGSPALDLVTPPCPDVFAIPVLEDQLGNPRPSPYGAARCDSGAVEGISDLLFRDGFESAAVTARMRRCSACWTSPCSTTSSRTASSRDRRATRPATPGGARRGPAP